MHSGDLRKNAYLLSVSLHRHNWRRWYIILKEISKVQAAAKGWGRDLLSGFGSPPQFDYSQLASRIFIALNSHIPTIPSTIDRQLEQRISCELQLLLP